MGIAKVMDTKLVNPLNELKRRFEDQSIPITKRLCLAKNVISNSYFATTPKEIIVGDWISSVVIENKVSKEEIRDYLSWLAKAEKITQDLKSKIIKVVAHYITVNDIEPEDILSITSFIATDSISKELHNQIQEYLIISKHLLLYFKNENNTGKSIEILTNYIQYYKECKRKLEFTDKFIKSDNLDIIFDCLETSDLADAAFKVCQEILFSDTKKTSYALYFKALIRQETVDKLLEETSLTLQSVLKIMDVIFKFPTERISNDPIFIQKFIDTFVKSYQKEHQLIFAFYIICVNVLNMEQNYLIPNSKLCTIEFSENEEKVKRKLFLKMLETLLNNDIDISIRLTDTLGEKISKVEHKKNFTVFLETVMLNQLKLEGKPDKVTFQIVITAMKLDPLLIEKKMPNILPHLMISKKSNNINVYTEMLNYLLETLFKLSRGNLFINKLLPHLKLMLEEHNTDQFELKMKLKELSEKAENSDKVLSKIINPKDIFPDECAEKFGLLTSELMFRQCGELLLSLQKDFEEHCLIMLEERYISPSIILIAEIFSNIFHYFFQNCKLADHTVPAHISEEFWNIFQRFETEILQKFGECLFKLSFDPQITEAFLKICIGYAQLKILNVQYSNQKISTNPPENLEEVFDLSTVLPCLTCKQWNKLQSWNLNNESIIIFDNLLILKIIYYKINDPNNELTETKTHLLNEIEKKIEIFNSTIYFPEILLNNLNTQQVKQFTKILLQVCFDQPESNILKQEYIINNKNICYSFSMEIIKTLLKLIEKEQAPPNLSKAIKKSDFNIKEFITEINTNDYFNQLSNEFDNSQIDTLLKCIDFLKEIRVYNTNENCILTTVFVLLAIKSVINKKKHKKCIDSLLQTIFELSNKHPDVFQIFSVDFMFAFPDNKFSSLVMLNVKTSNRLMIMKIILEIAVKKVKTDSEIVKNIVNILLLNQKSKDGSGIEYFSNEVFQISCLILPLIAKEKKAITTSAYRSILAKLQEKLHRSLLECFKNIDFATEKSLFLNNAGNPEESLISENTVATLNAIDAFSLTLSKYCESNDAEAIQNLDALWSGLGYFVDHAILSLHNIESKPQHVLASIQLINSVLRYIKKLEAHDIFLNKDDFFLRIWKSVLARLMIIFGGKKRDYTKCLEELGVTMKFFCELSSVYCFVTNFVVDLARLTILKKPTKIVKQYNTKTCPLVPHKVALYLWTHSLKSNIIVPKCAALSKCIQSYCKNLITWLTKHFDTDMKKLILEEMHDSSEYYIEHHNNDKVDYQDDIIDEDNIEIDGNDNIDNELGDLNDNIEDEDEIEHKNINKKVIDYKIGIEHPVCEVLVTDMNMLSEVILAAKRISLNYKFIDLIFEIQNIVFPILDFEDISWSSIYIIIDACVSILNSFLVSREELLEDRWPLFNICYRKLVSFLCRKSSTEHDLDRDVLERLAELAHSIEKLTQSFCKRKQQISRLASYLVGDVCSWLEEYSPARPVRQHLENSVVILIRASDSSYTPGFLKRAMEHIPGQLTMVNVYSMYKRYHKYVGNA